MFEPGAVELVAANGSSDIDGDDEDEVFDGDTDEEPESFNVAGSVVRA